MTATVGREEPAGAHDEGREAVTQTCEDEPPAPEVAALDDVVVVVVVVVVTVVVMVPPVPPIAPPMPPVPPMPACPAVPP